MYPTLYRCCCAAKKYSACPLRLRLYYYCCFYRCYYYYFFYYYYYFYRLLLYPRLATLLLYCLSCLPNLSGCYLTSTTLLDAYRARIQAQHCSSAARPHPPRRPQPQGRATVLERILLHVRTAQAKSPALSPDRLQRTRGLCTARPAIPAASPCVSPDSAAPSPQSAVALARTR